MRIFLITLLVSVSSMCRGEDLSGQWSWANNNDQHTFSIKLSKSGEGYRGTYCAVGMSGGRIDCSPEYASEFKTKVEGEEFKFVTNYSGKNGIARLSIDGTKLLWEIVREPSGEHYAPSKAFLYKSR